MCIRDRDMHKQNQKALFGIIVIIAMMIVGLIYTSYSRPSSHHKVFGVTYMTMNNPFYEIINNELEKVIDQNGDRLITLDPALDVTKQNEQIHFFIDQNVDGIFVNPIDYKQIQPALLAAKKAHIPIIVVDAPIKNKELVNCTICLLYTSITANMFVKYQSITIAKNLFTLNSIISFLFVTFFFDIFLTSK